MSYLVIGLILLLIIAPIFAVLPSARQKEQMNLRRQAMAKGFQVDFETIDDPDPDPEQYLSNTGKPLARVMRRAAYRYARRRPSDWRRLPQVDWSVVRRPHADGVALPAGWDWDEPIHPAMSNELEEFLRTNLVSLPNDVVRVEEKSYIISVFWNEEGGPEAVQAIIDFVLACAAATPYMAHSGDG